MISSPSPAALLADLGALGLSVCETFPYAAELGARLSVDEPVWREHFAAEHPELAGLPLAQARDYAFLNFAEARPGWASTLRKHLEDYVRDGPHHLHAELTNTVAWYHRQAGAVS